MATNTRAVVTVTSSTYALLGAWFCLRETVRCSGALEIYVRSYKSLALGGEVDGLRLRSSQCYAIEFDSSRIQIEFTNPFVFHFPALHLSEIEKLLRSQHAQEWKTERR